MLRCARSAVAAYLGFETCCGSCGVIVSFLVTCHPVNISYLYRYPSKSGPIHKPDVSKMAGQS